ncbi:MAG: glucosaminidase domain-containing protein, partial [Moorea sp. SIO2I5]|nr:glucosaminidase domain-containing protein [Moorena sp. SIO2I5]
MGMGNATESQLKSFLEKNNQDGLKQFPDLPRLYIEEAENEGVNHDVAFCQMCLETDYLRFGGKVKPEQNNFCGLGTVDASAAGATFPDPKTGVKAHIEHLKAYASTDMINQLPIVDPRFDYVPRGVAPSVYDLGRRWNPDLEYGNQIMVFIKQLYGVF